MSERLVVDGIITDKFTLNGQPTISISGTDYTILKYYWDRVNIGDRVRLYESDEYGGFKVEVIEEVVYEPDEIITHAVIENKHINTAVFPWIFLIRTSSGVYKASFLQYIILNIGDTVILPTDNTDILPKQNIRGLMI